MSADKRKEIAERHLGLAAPYRWTGNPQYVNAEAMLDAAMREYAALVLEEAAKEFKEASGAFKCARVPVAGVTRVLLARAAEERKG